MSLAACKIVEFSPLQTWTNRTRSRHRSTGYNRDWLDRVWCRREHARVRWSSTLVDLAEILVAILVWMAIDRDVLSENRCELLLSPCRRWDISEIDKIGNDCVDVCRPDTICPPSTRISSPFARFVWRSLCILRTFERRNVGRRPCRRIRRTIVMDSAGGRSSMRKCCATSTLGHCCWPAPDCYCCRAHSWAS